MPEAKRSRQWRVQLCQSRAGQYVAVRVLDLELAQALGWWEARFNAALTDDSKHGHLRGWVTESLDGPGDRVPRLVGEQLQPCEDNPVRVWNGQRPVDVVVAAMTHISDGVARKRRGAA